MCRGCRQAGSAGSAGSTSIRLGSSSSPAQVNPEELRRCGSSPVCRQRASALFSLANGRALVLWSAFRFPVCSRLRHLRSPTLKSKNDLRMGHGASVNTCIEDALKSQAHAQLNLPLPVEVGCIDVQGLTEGGGVGVQNRTVCSYDR